MIRIRCVLVERPESPFSLSPLSPVAPLSLGRFLLLDRSRGIQRSGLGSFCVARQIALSNSQWPTTGCGQVLGIRRLGMNSTGKKVRDLDARCLAEHRLRRRPCQPAFNSFRAATDMDAKGQIQSTSSHQPAERTSAL
ncbi:hypothetical protein CLIM01_08041 [Colletotrichum limetticola]|uniref:Uncharacterized protein n=1 Tax=Colletotrichum limetticola TaxID=1209924 RepID=A0ABQ9PSQ9_9PEZI|nr:hypothetical protein CLIM01_08041 [Colletotrichum limetticola]